MYILFIYLHGEKGAGPEKMSIIFCTLKVDLATNNVSKRKDIDKRNPHGTPLI